MKSICLAILILLVLSVSCAPTPTVTPHIAESMATPQIAIVIPTVTATASPSPLPSPTPTPSCAAAVPPRPSTTMELYGTFHAMGVIVSIAAADDPNQKASALVEYRTGSKPYRPGFLLSRISATQFVGSLFWLEPGTAYDVRVIFRDSNSPLNCMTMQATAATRTEITIPTPKSSYYVSPDGSGSACTLSAPCALVTGINRALAGDAVVLRGGVYYEGEITFRRSGRADAPIIIQSYPGEKAVLDGSDPIKFTWTNLGNGVYRTSTNAPDSNLVVANGQRLYPYRSLADLQSLRWKVPGFYATGTALYVRLENDADPNGAEINISRYEYGFWLEQNFIDILNLTFRYYGRSGWRTAVYLRNGNDNVIMGNKFVINDFGVLIRFQSYQNVFQDNEFYDTTYRWDWDAVKDRTGLETGGIRFHREFTGRGNIIRRNVFHDFFDGFGACPYDPATIIQAGITNETDVYENLIYNVGDDGMETDGACSNVRIWSNNFHDVLVGVSLAPARIGPVYAIRNLIYNLGRVAGCPFGFRGPCGGTAFKFQYEFPGSGPMYIFHNTADAGSYGNSIYFSAPATWPMLMSRNNIWKSSSTPIMSYTSYAVENPSDFDYDAFWGTESGTLVSWRGIRYSTLSSFATSTGQERHGLNINPSFTDPSKGDYKLLSISQLIDAGVLIPGINDDFKGRAPDIGAFEYQ